VAVAVAVTAGLGRAGLVGGRIIGVAGEQASAGEGHERATDKQHAGKLPKFGPTMARTTSSMLPWVTIAAWMGCVATPAESIPASSTSHEPGHEQLSLESKVLGELRRVNIYLPPDYRRSTTSRYPILYMPDGGTQEDFPHLTETVDAAIRRGDIRPIIVVGIENTQRRRDLTGPTEVAADREIAPVVGGSAAFRGFLREELLPSIE